MIDDLQLWSKCLGEQGVTHVVMESTANYRKPIYNVLEERFELPLVTAQLLKAVPGRKTDVKDAEGIADLLRHGLLRPSYVPDRQQRELRELVRYRTSLVQEHTAEANRLQKVLEGANIKLASVASDILGRSGREMLEALVAGQTGVVAMAELARGRMREKRTTLERALAGRFGPHQRLLVAEILAHIDYLDETIERLNAKIAERERPFEVVLDRLDTISGVSRRSAELIVAEVGPDVHRFPSPGHLASWAGLSWPERERWEAAPWQDPQRQSLVRSALVEAAQAATRSRIYLAAQFRRLCSRRGGKKAIVAVAHTILRIVYHLLIDQHPYDDLGETYFDDRQRDLVSRRLARRLQRLGYRVHLEPLSSAA